MHQIRFMIGTRSFGDMATDFLPLQFLDSPPVEAYFPASQAIQDDIPAQHGFKDCFFKVLCIFVVKISCIKKISNLKNV
jgi:hypothetical protein